jgi:hypothetical protein
MNCEAEPTSAVTDTTESTAFTMATVTPPKRHTPPPIADDIPLPDCPPPEWHNYAPPPIVPTAPVSHAHTVPGVIPMHSMPMPHPLQTEEKFYFGKRALILCLTIIGILSMTTAMFIGLYLDRI